MKTLSLRLLLPALLHAAPTSPAATTNGSPDRDQILAVVQQFFDAMAAKNGEALRALFVPGAQVASLRMTAGGPVLRQRTAEEDAQRIPANPDRLLERMWTPTVLVDGRIAVVWTPYDFHINGRFSHSGTDAFTLFKTDAGWKIAMVGYSVEPDAPSRHPQGPP
ncbi:MAG: nuclear transport factor 2 family protein [Verrucomicrobia bacterium]|nr:nuclear transport factor 2 family protein [Verrucomicrobiota bacterium]